MTLLAIFMFSSAANAQLIIDDFDTGETLFQLGVGDLTQTTAAAEILGAQRIDSISVPAVPGAGNGVLGFNNSNLSVGQGSSDQVVGSVFYDALAGFDLTDGGTLGAFLLDITSSDDNALPINDVLEISVGANGTTTSQSVTIPAIAQPVFVNFSEFTGVDFTSVDSLAIGFDFANDPGGDFTIGSFEVVGAVPEPSSLCLLSMASLVFVGRRRRV